MMLIYVMQWSYFQTWSLMSSKKHIVSIDAAPLIWNRHKPSWTLSSSLNYKFCICSYKSSLSHHKEDLPPFGCLLSYTVSNYKSQQIKILFATTNAHKRTTNGGTTKSIENLLQKETKQHKGEFIFILYRNRTTICQNWTTNGYKLSGVIHSTM